jgi:hypothetical protein
MDVHRVLRRIVGPNMDEETGDWRQLNEELTDPYPSPNIIQVIKSRRMSEEGHVACMVKRKSAYRVSVGKPEGKRPLGRPRCRWEDNIKLQAVGWGGGTDWSYLAQDRDRWRAVVNAVMNFRTT